ncbi:MAG: bifunctional protein-disulfide isomerase/oxidoreductase DsbC [Wenzhouxiangellaceae bacterium]
MYPTHRKLATRFVAILALITTGMLPVASQADENSLDHHPLLQKLQQRWPQLQPTHMGPAPVADLTEIVVLPANTVLYANTDSGWLVQGALIDLESGENLSEQSLAAARHRAMASLPDLNYFEYPAADERRRLTVITDIDCPYCRRLHQDVPALNEAGISVRYLMLPRAGIDSDSYHKAVAAACAQQPAAALTRSFLGEDLPPAEDCEHHIADQYRLAQQLGANLTPMVIDDTSGRTWPGYPGLESLRSALQDPAAAP